MTMHIGVGGNHKQVTKIAIGAGGVWKTVLGMWIGVGGAWKKFYDSVIYPAGSFSSFRTDTGQPSVTFITDGTVTVTGIGMGGDWVTPTTAGIGNTHWVKFHMESGTGTPQGGPWDTWLQLNTNKSAAMSAAPAASARNIVGTYQIATDSGGTNVVGSGSFTLDSDRS